MKKVLMLGLLSFSALAMSPLSGSGLSMTMEKIENNISLKEYSCKMTFYRLKDGQQRLMKKKYTLLAEDSDQAVSIIASEQTDQMREKALFTVLNERVENIECQNKDGSSKSSIEDIETYTCVINDNGKDTVSHYLAYDSSTAVSTALRASWLYETYDTQEATKLHFEDKVMNAACYSGKEGEITYLDEMDYYTCRNGNKEDGFMYYSMYADSKRDALAQFLYSEYENDQKSYKNQLNESVCVEDSFDVDGAFPIESDEEKINEDEEVKDSTTNPTTPNEVVNTKRA